MKHKKGSRPKSALFLQREEVNTNIPPLTCVCAPDRTNFTHTGVVHLGKYSHIRVLFETNLIPSLIRSSDQHPIGTAKWKNAAQVSY